MDLDLDEGEEPDAEGSIRMVKTEEVYDMTYSDEDEDWCVCGLEGDGVVYFDSFTGVTGMSPLVERMEKVVRGHLNVASSEGVTRGKSC